MEYFITYLKQIINDSFQTGNFPEVTPVYKKKDPLNKENYRPVSFLSQVSKVFEKILYEQINSHI